VPTTTADGQYLGQPTPEAEARLSSDPEDLVETLERVTTGKRILVVDDNPKMVRTITSLLEPVGFRALGCTSGSQAVAMARDLRPDAILLDTVMPEINGFDVLRLLKSDPATSEIPVVIISEGDD
jgi:PleD family two-component response regulator